MDATEEVVIDTNLYSRQIGTFGLETMGKLIKMKVLIVGLRGLGVETAKNLILAGPASVTLHDPTPCEMRDLGSNFYLTEQHVKDQVSRADAVLEQLQTLNPNVKVNVKKELFVEDHAQFSCVTYTENFRGFDHLVAVDKFCREHRVGFLLCETLGLAGYAFSDFGPAHVITDGDGEQCKSFIVVSISQDEEALVTVHEDKRHSYQEGDFVRFAEVEGMEAINGAQPFEISAVRGPYAFKIKADSRSWDAYRRQGVVEDVKVPRPQAYHSLEQSAVDPVASSKYGMLETPDLRHFGRSDQLHVAVRTVHAFQRKHGRYPGPSDAEEVLTLARTLNAEAKAASQHFVEELEESIVLHTANYSTCAISAQAAFFGGFLAQEIVKYTGKYTPLQQWLHYDCFEALPSDAVEREPEGGRYDDQIRIFGRAVQRKLERTRTFMVGAGALGCEFIKSFAMMGLGCGEGGMVYNTDNDNIEVSNLNRQFLFR